MSDNAVAALADPDLFSAARHQEIARLAERRTLLKGRALLLRRGSAKRIAIEGRIAELTQRQLRLELDLSADAQPRPPGSASGYARSPLPASGEG